MESAIVGTGLTPFGKHLGVSLKALAGSAISEALADAQVEVHEVEMAFVANAMAAVTTGQVSVVGQTILRAAGFAGIPVFNIDNACASSSSALTLALHAVAAGAATTVLVVGVEKLYAATRALSYRALNGAADQDFVASVDLDVEAESIFVKAVYPERLRAYAERYSLAPETLARIAVKNRAHAALNPLAQYRQPLTIDDVLAAKTIVTPITALMCAPIGDGAAAVVVTRGNRAAGVSRRPVWVRSSAIGMGSPPNEENSIGRVARKAYAQSGLGPQDVDVAEVHDSTSFTELQAYEELGFSEFGKAHELVDEGRTSLGGPLPVNPSGGLESRGHPVAATGLAQIVELVGQLRGDAGPRTVPDARVGLAENAGGYAGGDSAAIAITILGAQPGDS